jgi:hypothetical protein
VFSGVYNCIYLFTFAALVAQPPLCRHAENRSLAGRGPPAGARRPPAPPRIRRRLCTPSRDWRVWAAFESRDEVQKVRLASLLFDLEAMAREKQPRNRPVSHTVPHPLYFHITTSQRECRIQVRVIIVRTSDPAFNAYGGGVPLGVQSDSKCPPSAKKFPLGSLWHGRLNTSRRSGPRPSGGARCV